MKELMKLMDVKAAVRLQGMLQEAGVGTEMTRELSNAYTGAMLAVVWVEDHAPPGVVDRVKKEFEAWVAAGQEKRQTHVEFDGDEGTRCLGCGYDLRGQLDDGECPECGRPYTLGKERACPACKEMVPEGFEVCWNCGAAMGGDGENAV